MLPFVFVGLVVAGLVSIGIGVRATYGAQTTADEPQYLLSAISLFEDRDLDISDELALERAAPFREAELPVQTEVNPDGSQLSPHGPLLPLILALPMGLWGWVGAKASLAVIGGLLAAVTAWTMHHRFRVGFSTTFVTTLLFALAPPLAVYSTQVYPEIVAGLAVIVAVGALAADPRRPWLAMAVVIVLPWLAVKYAPVAAVLAIWLLHSAAPTERRRLMAILVVAGALFAAFHQAIYGGLTPYAAGDHFVGGELTAVGTEVNLWGRATRLVGLLVDRGFGLGSWQPLYLLIPLVAAWGWRRHPDLRWPIAVLVVAWLTATFVALTMHGWWFPGRQLIVALPITAVLIGVWADETRLRLGTVAMVGAVGVAAFVILVSAGLSGEITWVVDFAATDDPLRGLARVLLPNYMTPSPTTWALHGLWSVIVGGALFYGWRSARSVAGGHQETEAQAATVAAHVNL
ncbi:MAG: hypothetical protein GEU79_04245 [Acidimicrobiia bacterium]|nr:hypothetical protein [Acidimicrobiia bacterium]